VQATLEQRSGLTLRVRDTGSAVPAELAKDLLRGPVASRSGLGIGLYQAARQAEAAGYALSLETNRDGNVCFALTGPAA
jgi:sensor histidine kinase regulating citrate/malate metabolism